jgi:predicted aconitase
VRLSDDEQRMYAGEQGPAVQKAMDLLVRYGEALGAERLADTRNVCGANVFTPRQRALGGETSDAAFSRLSLDSDEVVEMPRVRVFSCQLIGPMDREEWTEQGIPDDVHEGIEESMDYSARHGVHLMNTCTPYQVGNVPVRGEICAWMESSAVVYINSVLGARSNVEGRESTAAAMLTGKIPYWGYHLDENRFGTHLVEVEVDVESPLDWGMLGYFVGERVDDRIPVLEGIHRTPDLLELKHFGAAAASSGGVELYHVPGVTAEARTREEAFGPNEPLETFRYGEAERRETYEALNCTGSDRYVDLVMLGCPHAGIEQIREICNLVEGKRVHSDTALWVFTPSPIRRLAEQNGYARILADAGAKLMSDTCPAIGQFLPKGARVIATDSAKQVHYLPAIMGVQGWFGSTRECVEAALTGSWSGGLA